MWFAESKSSIIVFVRNLGIFPWSHARYALARLYTMLRGNPRVRNLQGQVWMKIDQIRRCNTIDYQLQRPDSDTAMRDVAR